MTPVEREAIREEFRLLAPALRMAADVIDKSVDHLPLCPLPRDECDCTAGGLSSAIFGMQLLETAAAIMRRELTAWLVDLKRAAAQN